MAEDKRQSARLYSARAVIPRTLNSYVICGGLLGLWQPSWWLYTTVKYEEAAKHPVNIKHLTHLRHHLRGQR